MDKKISVVMCTFNGEKYLREQLDSILNQTYPIYEIYIQDDCSTDNTASILKEYQEKFPIISYSVNKENLGVSENFFSAFERVSGEFIAISDQDDIWLPEKLQKVAEMIGENLLCFSRSIPFSNDGSLFHFDKEIPNYGLERMLFLSIIYGHNILFKAELLKLIPKGYNFCMYEYDGLIALTAAVYNRITLCNSFLCDYRRHNSTTTIYIPRSYEKSFWNVIQMFIESFRLFFLLKSTVEKHYEKLFHYLKEYENGEELSHLQDCIIFVGYLSKQSIFSLIKASRWCLRHRNDIFYKKESNDILAIGRSIFFPILMYQYWNYLAPRKRK